MCYTIIVYLEKKWMDNPLTFKSGGHAPTLRPSPVDIHDANHVSYFLGR